MTDSKIELINLILTNIVCVQKT